MNRESVWNIEPVTHDEKPNNPTGCDGGEPGQSKTWVLFGKTNHGKLSGEILYRLVGQGKKLFRWRLPEGNPYLRTETRNTYTSRFTEVAMAFASI
ncbi:hypothetical protein GY32_21380 [Escherichia coli]|nr:hypothetical protein JQ59_22865 [Escherichia coli]KGT04047.1 hypothetical protein GY32_21380 [Escherichia coli]